jgi:hypothetical protein
MLLAFDLAVYSVAVFLLVLKRCSDEPASLNLRG